MLYFMVVLSLFSVAFGDIGGRPVIRLQSIILDNVKQAAADCIKETGAGQEVSDNFLKLQFGPDVTSRKFLYCLCLKTNYGDEDGRLNDAFLSLFEGDERKDKVQKVLEDCNKNKDKTKIDTLYKVVQCFYKNTPVVLVI